MKTDHQIKLILIKFKKNMKKKREREITFGRSPPNNENQHRLLSDWHLFQSNGRREIKIEKHKYKNANIKNKKNRFFQSNNLI